MPSRLLLSSPSLDLRNVTFKFSQSVQLFATIVGDVWLVGGLLPIACKEYIKTFGKIGEYEMLKIIKKEDRPLLQFDDWLEMVELGDETDILSDVLELFERAEKPIILHS